MPLLMPTLILVLTSYSDFVGVRGNTRVGVSGNTHHRDSPGAPLRFFPITLIAAGPQLEATMTQCDR
ncbi:hypothetical protein RRG08_044338 [Elysia crispata]|uniref:Secreted protein n=1 Tax=Elysia crispata TaxID=231223 RepID=A0AAE1DUF1_9GAST|nr:hypothetical protein RRG08_044338 [Elysia crispata]